MQVFHFLKEFFFFGQVAFLQWTGQWVNGVIIIIHQRFSKTFILYVYTFIL